MIKKPTVAIYHDTRYLNSDNKAQAKIRVTFPGISDAGKKTYKPVYYETGVWLSPKDFETMTTVVSLRNDELRAAKTCVYNLFTKAENIVNDNQYITRDLFELNFNGGYDLESVYGLFEHKILELRRKEELTKKPSSVSGYIDAQRVFEQYAGKGLTLYSITKNWLVEFELKQVEKGNSYNYIKILLSSLRHIFNRAIALKKISADLFPFGQNENQYQIPSESKEKVFIEDRNQLAALLDYTSNNKMHQRAADFCKLVFYLFGLNNIDILQLRWTNIVRSKELGDYIEIFRQKTVGANKTKRKLRIPINAEAWTIINRWGTKTLNMKDFVFPILRDDMTAQQIKNKAKTFRRVYVNTPMKEVCKELGISIKLDSYAMRHTFSDYCFNDLEQSMQQVGAMLGHAKPETTQHYFHGFRHKHLSKVSSKLGQINKKTG